MYEYVNNEIALLTKHGKQLVMSEVMKVEMGLKVIHVDSYDTDLFGTFTRDIPREGNQYEAALKKAIKAIELAETHLGMSSEGLFTSDPFLGIAPWNNELVLFLDQKNNIEITGFSSAPAQAYSALISVNEDIEQHLEKALFPSHYLVIRPDGPDSIEWVKGVCERKDCESLIEYFFTKSTNGKVFIENDLRAFANPKRMQNIKNATINLAEKLKSYCPSCGCPGYSVTKHVAGLPCLVCGSKTKGILSSVLKCKKCSYQSTILNPNSFAEQANCDFCNP
jgi:hypothetical protein